MSSHEIPVISDHIQALIFDCDGTLADTFAAHYRTFREALVPYAIEFNVEFYAARLGLSRRQLLAELEAMHGVTIDDEDIRARTPAMFLNHVGAVKAVPFTEAFVRQHHGRLKLGVASAGQKAMVSASLRAIGLVDLFDTIVTIEDTGVPKPAPDLFLKAAANMAVGPEACHVFEDSDEGVEAARRAGMTVTDIRPFYQSDPATW
ncbi:MAG: HAD family phosphatase [Asticcacaulis sp.]|nr:HAD family phosphatase [Asticcacaulis sp.]